MLTEPSCAPCSAAYNPLQTPRVAEKGGEGCGDDVVTTSRCSPLGSGQDETEARR